VLGAISVGANTRICAGSVLLRDVGPDCTVVGIPGRVIHQSGVRIDPLAHSALPDAEARVIRNLMDRIDQLENQIDQLRAGAAEPTMEAAESGRLFGPAQNLRDREILEFFGDTEVSTTAEENGR